MKRTNMRHLRITFLIAFLLPFEIQANAVFSCLNLFKKSRIESFKEAIEMKDSELKKDIDNLKEKIMKWPIDYKSRERIIIQIASSEIFARKMASISKQFESDDFSSEQKALIVFSTLRSWESYFAARKVPVEKIKVDISAKPNVRVGDSIYDLQAKFDVISRKTANLTDGSYAGEIEVALATGKIPKARLTIAKNDSVSVGEPMNGEKVFAVGFDGALNFQGKNSSTDRSRIYAVILPKGFLQKLAVMDSRGDMTRDVFFSVYGASGKAFYIKFEKATAIDGQVHVHMGRDWAHFLLDHKIVRPDDIINEHIIQLVELDKHGNIIRMASNEI